MPEDCTAPLLAASLATAACRISARPFTAATGLAAGPAVIATDRVLSARGVAVFTSVDASVCLDAVSAARAFEVERINAALDAAHPATATLTVVGPQLT